MSLFVYIVLEVSTRESSAKIRNTISIHNITMSFLSYAARESNFQNAAAKALLACMERKKSNLCVSVDVTKKESVLRIVGAVAPYVCLIKASASFEHNCRHNL